MEARTPCLQILPVYRMDGPTIQVIEIQMGKGGDRQMVMTSWISTLLHLEPQGGEEKIIGMVTEIKSIFVRVRHGCMARRLLGWLD